MEFGVERPAREMGKLCTKETCRKSNKKHCKKIFNDYWEAGNKGMQDIYSFAR